MDQLTQELKSGKMGILEVPFPALGKGRLLVRNLYSVISAGTEGKTVRDARLGYLGKALSRSKELRQVIAMIKTQGFLSTYKMVMNKLEAPSALGYSCAGEVIALGEGVDDIKVGDFVACGGADAVHAEVVAVPRNLCAIIPEGVEIRHAAFTTIASIAVQGIRQSDLRMGEYCVVIGLGLIGQLTLQILEASGIKAIGLDIDEYQVEAAKVMGHMHVFNRNQEGIEPMISQLTGGQGADAVIITAGSSSLDPVDLAGRIARRKGKVVIVGAVPTGFSREHYYRKELELRMSTSYGPGRYDSGYEEKGQDYPIAYVRWTENRNMQAFLQLLSDHKVDIEKLITHTFRLEDAPDAYQMILERSEPFNGILIEYDITGIKPARRIEINTALSTDPKLPQIGFIGAGSFAQNILLPLIRDKASLVGIATNKGNNSLYVGRKYRFSFCTDSAEEVIESANVNTVFITTRHNDHAKYVIAALKQGKHVFVEKPLAMNMDEMFEILEVYRDQTVAVNAMVGFNRRFSPHVLKVRQTFLDSQSKAIHIRVNSGAVSRAHWVNDPETGGGRIIGEACHFVDLARHLAGAEIETVFAAVKADANALNDTAAITLTFTNGSVANISYFSNGNKMLPKEYIEVFCDGAVAIIDDFKRSRIMGRNSSRLRTGGQDKGHAAEVVAFLNSIAEGKPSPIPFLESWQSMAATFAVLHSIKTGQAVNLNDFIHRYKEMTS